MRIVGSQRITILVIIKLLSLKTLVAEHLRFFRLRTSALILESFIFLGRIASVLARYS
jgi:hypothetical protein